METNEIKRLIQKLRSITLSVQIAPFAYSVLQLFVIIVYFVWPDREFIALDSLFYISPAVIVMMLAFSKVLKLCRWHKAACLVPAIPQGFSLADYFLNFSSAGVYVTGGMIIAMIAVLLIAAYKVFLS